MAGNAPPMTAAKMLAAQNAASQAPTPKPAAKDPNQEFVVNLEGIDPAHLASKPLEEVVLDALVVMKIIKHCRDNHPITAYGQLLGVDIAGSLQVTNCFPVTSKTQDDESEGAAADEIDGAEYQLQMLRCLRKLNFDANSVGLYVSTHLGSFWNQTIVENQYSYQKMYAQSVLIVYDHTRTAQGNLSLRALRLSDTFMELFKEKKFTMEALHAHKLTPSGIFESLPVRINNSFLLNALLSQIEEDHIVDLTTPLARPATTFLSPFPLASPSPLSPNFDALELGNESYIERHLEYLGETVDEHGQEQWRWQGWHRQLQKEQARAAQIAAKKRQENQTRASAGLPPVHTEEDILAPTPALQKVLSSEPSRLETLIISNQIDTYCKQVNQFAGPSLSKMYLTKAFARLKQGGQ
ncbi:Eukaryotic translation initiation factor 3 subunit H [Phlyctochytrium bullatum]|nr:Eukaryotic translation initiation factor 3 subunit H [Phlyctochytrium bullatum]